MDSRMIVKTLEVIPMRQQMGTINEVEDAMSSPRDSNKNLSQYNASHKQTQNDAPA